MKNSPILTQVRGCADRLFHILLFIFVQRFSSFNTAIVNLRIFVVGSEGNAMRSSFLFRYLTFGLQLAVLVSLTCFAFPGPASAQTPFTRTYQLGGNIEVSCCTNGMSYGFTPVIQDNSLSGPIQITSISASDNGSILATDPSGVAGTTWEIFVGTASCGFPVGQISHVSIQLGTYTCSSATQLIFNTNGTFTAPASGTFAGSYNFEASTFTANDMGALVSAHTTPSTLSQGLFVQILLWGGDQGADLKLSNISLTITGTVGTANANPGKINTVAGGVPNNVPARSAALGVPTAAVKDASGNLYVPAQSSALLSGEIFKIDTNGNLTTVAGNGGYPSFTISGDGDGGLAVNAALGFVTGLAVDSQQNLYLSDSIFGTIRKVDGTTHVITTFAGGGTGCGNGSVIGDGCAATSAVIANPGPLFLDANHNLFISDTGNSRIREVVASTGKILTVGGGGTGCTGQLDNVGDGCAATSAKLLNPQGVFVDSHNNIFVSDSSNFRIREVSGSTGIIQSIAGTGVAGYNGDGIQATTAQISNPQGVSVDSAGNVFFGDTGNSRVREIVASSGAIQTLAGGGSGCAGQTDIFGDNCPASSALIGFPYDIFLDTSNNLYIADEAIYLIREVAASGGFLTSPDPIQPFVGNGTPGFSGDGQLATNAQIGLPYGVAVDSHSNIYIADLDDYRVRKVDAVTGKISTVAGGNFVIAPACTNPTDYVGDGCLATQAIIYAFQVFVDSAGNLFISDDGSARIREVSASTGIVTTVAGGGSGCGNNSSIGDGCPATSAILSQPWGLYVDTNGNIFISDYGHDVIREVVASTGLIKTIAGTGTPGYNGENIPAVQAQINYPIGLYSDPLGNIFFSDLNNYRIREIVASTGNIVTVAGTGTPGYNGDDIAANQAQISFPYGIFVDHSGNIFFGDQGNGRVREVIASNGLIQTVAGNGTTGFSGDGGPATSAELAFPESVATDSNGNLYIADTFNNRIREVGGVVSGNTLAITTLALPNPSVGSPYSFGLQAVGGVPPYTWGIASGALPSDFSPLSSAGVISGTPGSADANITFAFTVKVTDSANNVQTQPMTFTVNPASVNTASATIQPSSLPFGNQIVSTTSSAQAISITSDGTAPFLISSIV